MLDRFRVSVCVRAEVREWLGGADFQVAIFLFWFSMRFPEQLHCRVDKGR